MAFVNKFGNILKQTVSKHIRTDFSAVSPSIYQAIRCMSSKLFIGGISYSTDDTSLREAFANYGEVIEARVIMDRETGRSRGFGFVTFASGDDASAAISAMDGKDLHGRIVRVNYATDRTGGFRSGGGGYGGGGYGGGGYGGGGYGDGGYGGGGGGGSYGGPRGGDYGNIGGDGYSGGSSGGGAPGSGSFGGSYNSGDGAPPASGYGGAADGGPLSGGSFGGSRDNFNAGFGNDGQNAAEGNFKDFDDEPNDYANKQA